MSKLPPVTIIGPGPRGPRLRETLVVWEIDNYTIPESFDPFLINEQIKSAIMKNSIFRGRKVSIWIFGAAENTWLKGMFDKLWEAGFEVILHKGDVHAGLRRILTDITFWSFSLTAPHNTNLLILSENYDKIEQDNRFCRFRQAFENKGFYVVGTNFESLINPETASALATTLAEPPKPYGILTSSRSP